MSWLDYLKSPPPPHVAPLNTDHARDVAEIHAASFARGWDALEFQSLIADRTIRGDGLFIGRGHKLVGMVVSRLVLDEAELLTIALARPARRRGWSRTLLASHLEGLAMAGIRTVFLEVEEENIAARNLYRGAGFRQIGRRESYYRRAGAEPGAALTMRLDIA